MNAPGVHPALEAPAEPTVPDVAYVLAEHPRMSTTFIDGEIAELRARGVRVLPISFNAASLPDRGHPPTVPLKAAPRSVARAAVGTARRHPAAFARLAWKAARTGGTDLAAIGRRLVHLTVAARAAEACREQGITHLHAHFGQAPATIAWLAAEIGTFETTDRWTWSMTIHGLDIEPAGLVEKVEAAAFTACATDFTRSQVLRLCPPRSWSTVHTVRCGIRLDDFPERASTSHHDRRPDGTPPRITTVGRLAPEKGMSVLVDAVRRLRDHHGITTRLVVAGDGPERAALERQIADADLTDRVEFLGEVAPSSIGGLLAGSDVFCLASFSEGLPVAVMEAMAVGVPVVTTHIAGLPELARDGVTARTVPPANPAALAEALADVLTDLASAAERARRARLAVTRDHDRVRTVDRLMTLLVQATHGADEPPRDRSPSRPHPSP